MLRFALRYDMGIHLHKNYVFMKCEIADFQRVNSLVEIFENQKLFIKPQLGSADIALALGVEVMHLELSAKIYLGLSLRELTHMYRVQLAAELLKKGVPYKVLYKYSGFSSFSCFKRAINDIVY